jgi:hypothetical protein
MVDVDAKHAFEVTAVEDQQQVETLGTHNASGSLVSRRFLGRRASAPRLGAFCGHFSNFSLTFRRYVAAVKAIGFMVLPFLALVSGAAKGVTWQAH